MPYSLNSEKTEKLSQKYFKIDWNLYFNVEFGVRKSEFPNVGTPTESESPYTNFIVKSSFKPAKRT